MGDFAGAQPEFRALGRQTSAHIENALERGRVAMDYRASLGRVASRQQRGADPVVCPWCACELDVDAPAHSFKCKQRKEEE